MNFLPASALNASIWSEHVRLVPEAIPARCAAELLFQSGKPLVLAKALQQRPRMHRGDVAALQTRHLQHVPRVQIAEPDGVLGAESVFPHRAIAAYAGGEEKPR
jgi:hypothetical protein